MKLLKKDNKNKSTSEAVSDFRNAYLSLINQKNFPSKSNKTYAITITDTQAKHCRDLNFLLTNCFFNRIHKDYAKSLNHINYIFVIEYPEAISRDFEKIDNVKVHAHIVVNTSIRQDMLEYYLKTTFQSNTDIFIENITERNDKDIYDNYLLKQTNINKFFNEKSYNYKIAIF